MPWGYLRMVGTKASISLYFSLLTGNAEKQFAQACVHRQPVSDILSPANHYQKTSSLPAETRKCHGDRDLQRLLIGKCDAKRAIFLRKQVGEFPFTRAQETSHDPCPGKKRNREFELTALRQRVSGYSP